MKDLPKELTPELLGLVYDYKIVSMELMPKIGHTQRLRFNYLDEDEQECEEALNIDTLTRLMMEFCYDNGVMLKISTSEARMGIVSIADPDGKPNLKDIWLEETLFEAVLKALEWVAKKKGLLK